MKNLAELITAIEDLDKKMQWQDATAADLAKSLVIEAAELLEHFQWDGTVKARGKELPVKDKEAIGYELADVLIYLLKISQRYEIDVVDMAFKKLKITEKKYEDKEIF